MKTIHLVMGLSNVGKSTFIESKIKNGDWRDISNIMAYELADKSLHSLTKNECVIHYNLLRPLKKNVKYIDIDFLDDTVIRGLFQFKKRIKAYVLITPRSELLRRVMLRKDVEPYLRSINKPYPKTKFLKIIKYLDLIEFHKSWFKLLQENGINYTIINSTKGNFSVVHSIPNALELITK